MPYLPAWFLNYEKVYLNLVGNFPVICLLDVQASVLLNTSTVS